MDIDRLQRTDIDNISDDRLTLAIDSLNTINSPYVLSLEEFEGNNWVLVDDSFIKYNIVEEDNLSFLVASVTELSEKNITNLIVSFDYVISDEINLNNISFSHDDIIEKKTVNYALYGTGHRYSM